MMDDRKHIVVGLFVLGGLVLLGVLVIWFEGVAGLIQERYLIKGHLQSGRGARVGKRVHKDGMEVGEVVDLTSSLPERPGVWVHMRINQDVEIPAEATFVAQQNLTGDVFLDFQTEVLSTDHLPKDGSATLEGVIRIPCLLPEDVLVAVREGITALKSLDPLSEDLMKLAGNLTQLTEPRGLDEVAAGKPANLSSAVKQFQATAKALREQIQEPESDFRRLLVAARESTGELNKTLADARQTFATVRETADVYKEAGAKVKALADQLKKDADQAGELIASANALVEGVRQGKGTLGKLVADEELHRTLTTLIENLNSLTENTDRLVTLWREEGVLAKENK